MLDPQRLRALRSVVASGSVQAAADQLGVTPSAVSQQIAALQRETGLALIEREGRGVRPTPAGTRIAIASGDALRSLNRLGALVRDLREGKTGHLTIGHFASVGLAWMPTIVKQLRQEFPDLMIELVLNDARSTMPTQPDIDVRIGVPNEVTPTGYQTVPLVDDPFVVAVHESHRFAQRSLLDLSELRDEDFVANDFVDSPVYQIQAQAFAAAGFSPRYIVHAADHLMALAFVDAGIGVSVVPVLAAQDVPDDVRLVALTEPTPVRHIYARVRESVATTPVARRVVDLLKRHTA